MIAFLEPEDAFVSLMGRRLMDWERGEDGGYHFMLDDGRILIIDGTVAIMGSRKDALH